jgi:tetratricopeptide (TPR) repeat protein
MPPPFPARAFLLVCAFLLVAPRLAAPQESRGTPAARAELTRGQAAAKAGDYVTAESAFKRAVELDPAWPEAHSSYQMAVRYVAGARIAEDGVVGGASAARYQKIIEPQYASWVKAHPKTPGYLWAYAGILAGTDPAKAEDLCKQALAVDAAFAPAYRTLARAASARGDVKAQLGFLRQASKAAPDSPNYLQAYISALWPTDFATARALALQMADRFPSDTEAAEVLFDLAAHTDDASEKVQYLERLRAQSGTVLQRAMRLLYDLYAASDPTKALALAEEMAARTPAGPTGRIWADAVARQKDVLRVRALIERKQFSEAVALLDVRAPRALAGTLIPNLDLSESSDQQLVLLRAEAEAGLDQTNRAYERVMDLFLQYPGDHIRDVLSRYGSALGKTPARQDDDVRARLTRDGKPAPDFPIATYPDGRKGSLSDLRGKVVLLNFWFPT